MQERVFNNPNIKILWDSEIVKASGEVFLEKVLVKNNKTGEEREYNAGGLFYAIGSDPNTSFLRDSDVKIKLDEEGYILTEADSTKTSQLGVYACGDVLAKNKKFRQAIVSAGTGCIAALEAIEYLQ
jgi:thioredoxin reductase (NADPH)